MDSSFVYIKRLLYIILVVMIFNFLLSFFLVSPSDKHTFELEFKPVSTSKLLKQTFNETPAANLVTVLYDDSNPDDVAFKDQILFTPIKSNRSFDFYYIPWNSLNGENLRSEYSINESMHPFVLVTTFDGTYTINNISDFHKIVDENTNEAVFDLYNALKTQ